VFGGKTEVTAFIERERGKWTYKNLLKKKKLCEEFVSSNAIDRV